ncbi:glyoxalase [Rhizobium sp. Leaf384]|uniref:VOC family protein n=1 Tax=unclassified Rhizobium TaxID=2613769 RepID=UPI00071571BE|nr:MULTISPECIES: VOC family protein [unclassified Rhizobium]KQS77255.1 glyoxalase [Rhizobium sp. Leaf383]KQS80822.1 glyoxalase [Rhizobium sp. Leaf384]
MLLYVTVGTNDPARAGTFYDAALAPLGLVRRQESGSEIGYGHPDDSRCRVWVVAPHDGRPATVGNGVTIALEAANRAAVDAFHAEGLRFGGTCEGAPGLRPFHAAFYAAFLRDPDGNKIAAVCERA